VRQKFFGDHLANGSEIAKQAFDRVLGRKQPDRGVEIRKVRPMTRQFAFEVVNVPADFGALGP
jgi:hypothetical protein